MSCNHALEVLGCRSFQALLKVGNYFIGYRMPQYLEGPGKIRELGDFLREKNMGDVLVVTGSGMVRRGQVEPMLEGFRKAGIRYHVVPFDHPDPSSLDVEAGFAAFKAQGCKAIVALGGGSRIDCAKAIAAKAAHPKKSVSQLQGLLKVHKPIVPFVAIPTTARAGSETTVAAVITDSETHRKAAINDPFLIPRYAVLDPELTVGLPPFTTATTGMDALAHAVEAYTNHTYNTKLENELAKEAVRLIHDNLYTAFEQGDNLEARQNMQRAAFYAGRAFTRGCVGYVHAIGHTLGGTLRCQPRPGHGGAAAQGHGCLRPRRPKAPGRAGPGLRHSGNYPRRTGGGVPFLDGTDQRKNGHPQGLRHDPGGRYRPDDHLGQKRSQPPLPRPRRLGPGGIAAGH